MELLAPKRPLIPPENDGDDANDDEEEEDEGPPGEEDENVLAELRLRRELLKKRLKDWEEDSGDEAKNPIQNAMQAELMALNQREGNLSDKNVCLSIQKNSKS